MTNPTTPQFPESAERLDDETERLITDLVIVAVRQYNGAVGRDETRHATVALRQRIRELVDTERKRAVAGLPSSLDGAFR